MSFHFHVQITTITRNERNRNVGWFSFFGFSDPERVNWIRAVQINDTKITLEWDTPKGEYDAFEIQYLNTNEKIEQDITNRTSITISNLRPHWNYTFTLVVISGTESSLMRKSNPVSASFTTSESYPGKVEVFQPSNVTPSEVTFEWSLPSQEQNGVIRKFSITYGLEVRIGLTFH